MLITDIHAHVFPDVLAEKAAVSIGDFYGVPMAHTASVDVLLEEDRKAGISLCVVSNSAVTPKQVHSVNNFLSEAAGSHPEFIGFGSIFPGMEGAEEELDRLTELGLRGIKIHSDFQKLPIDAPEAVPTYREIAKRGLPVLFHMGDYRYDYSSPERLTNLIRQVPDLKVIAAHFGGWTAWERSYEHPQPENVLYDTSSSFFMADRELLLRMFDRFGPERFLFGTDFPMWTPKNEVDMILSLNLGENLTRKIFSENFLQLFGLQDLYGG